MGNPGKHVDTRDPTSEDVARITTSHRKWDNGCGRKIWTCNISIATSENTTHSFKFQSSSECIVIGEYSTLSRIYNIISRVYQVVTLLILPINVVLAVGILDNLKINVLNSSHITNKCFFLGVVIRLHIYVYSLFIIQHFNQI